ncbi:MAG: hypothetical protein KKF68_00985 [Nanoarchaeota archaeon]|nr:hypothetical protein [Nanoarchaeota archaeon]
MKLNKKEKDILSIMNDSSEKQILEFAKKHTKYLEKDIKKIANKLTKENYVEKVKIPVGDKIVVLYFYTKKVTKDLLNDSLKWKKDFGYKFGEGIKDGPINKLRRYIKEK